MSQNTEVQLKNPRRVKKHDWLQAALDFLKTGGVEAVRVERLAAKLGVAKSGFYYHFRDRADLHAALLQYWVAIDHSPIFEQPQKANATPAEILASIAEIVDRDDLSRYDAAIRQWARQDPRVLRIWRREMKKRLSITRDLFAGLGFSGDDLKMRTRLFIGYHLSERELFPDLSAKDRAHMRDLRLKLLLTP